MKKLVRIIFLLVCAYSFYTNTLPQVFVTAFLFYTAYLLTSLFTKDFIKRIAFTPASFITFFVTIMFTANFASINLFMPALFVLYALLVLKSGKGFKIRFSKKHALLLLSVILVSGALRFLLYQKINYQLAGTDISRFGILSKTFEIKGKITPDLTPYDLPQSFFYFPSAYTVPLIFSFAGIDPITGITLFSFILNMSAIIAFYLFSKKLFKKELEAILSTLFFSIIFDHVLDYLVVRAVFSYAWGFYFFILGALALQQKKSKLWIPTITGILYTHWYITFPLFFLFLSKTVTEFIKKGVIKESFQILKNIVKPLAFSLTLTIPFFLVFGPHMSDRFLPMNWAEHKVGGSTFAELPIIEKLYLTFISHGASSNTPNIFYGLIIILMVLVGPSFFKEERTHLFLFYVFIAVFSFLLYSSLTFRRMLDFLKILYPLILAKLCYEHKPLIIIFLLVTPIILFTTPFYILNLGTETMPAVDPVMPEEFSAFNFIKTLPKDSVIMIDGGGTGCIAGSDGSHGDRIFPLTGKKVFLFTNYCWANYNRSEFERRLDLYRDLSINIDDTKTLDTLTKEYMVSHVYIGPTTLGLRSEDLRESNYYEEVFSENQTSVFQIIY